MNGINSNLIREFYIEQTTFNTRSPQRPVTSSATSWPTKQGKNPESFHTSAGSRLSQKERGVSHRGEIYRRKIHLDFNDGGTRRVVIDLPDPRIHPHRPPRQPPSLRLPSHQRHTNLPRYPRRARHAAAMGSIRGGCLRARGVPGCPACPACTHASIHAAKQIRRFGYAINVGAATSYGLVRVTVRCPLSPRGRPPVP